MAPKASPSGLSREQAQPAGALHTRPGRIPTCSCEEAARASEEADPHWDRQTGAQGLTQAVLTH